MAFHQGGTQRLWPARDTAQCPFETTLDLQTQDVLHGTTTVMSRGAARARVSRGAKNYGTFLRCAARKRDEKFVSATRIRLFESVCFWSHSRDRRDRLATRHLSFCRLSMFLMDMVARVFGPRWPTHGLLSDRIMACPCRAPLTASAPGTARARGRGARLEQLGRGLVPSPGRPSSRGPRPGTGR